jgi:arylsulfatase A-like enzyme
MFFAALCVHRTDARGVEPVRPNVLFLLTDDLRADAVGALGNRAIKTPTLDKLASSGFVFKNAYCQGSNSPAVCLTSRNMILSGRSYFRWKGSYAPGTPPNFPLTLAAAGYETYHDGKRGNVAVEIEKKFQHSHYIDDDRERKSGQPGKAIVDRAISFVKGRDRGRPFFMYLAFEAPHDPRVAAPEYLERYDPREIPLPANFLPVHPFDNGEMTVRDELLAPWPRTEAEIRRQLHEYFAVITGLDHHIGRLIETLKSSGDFDRTIVIFSSDHGLALGSHGLMGKQSLYEHSMKSPLLFAGPGIPRGSSSALAYLFDIFPTICELAGISIPAGLDGQSLAPIIAGRSDRVRDSIFLSYRDDQRAVRDDRWKLVRYPGINRSQLFDLENDPDERHDLAADSAQGPRLDRMTDLLRQWQSRLGDVLPLTTASPRNPRFVPPDK